MSILPTVQQCVFVRGLTLNKHFNFFLIFCSLGWLRKQTKSLENFTQCLAQYANRISYHLSLQNNFVSFSICHSLQGQTEKSPQGISLSSFSHFQKQNLKAMQHTKLSDMNHPSHCHSGCCFGFVFCVPAEATSFVMGCCPIYCYVSLGHLYLCALRYHDFLVAKAAPVFHY